MSNCQGTMSKIKNRKIVIVNQAVNYLTIGFANAFYEKFEDVTLITGSIHSQGEELHPSIKVKYINKWYESPARKKMSSYIKALINIWFLLFFKFRKHEVFFVSVPPMGYLLNLLLPHRFSMVIWDVYPDAFKIIGVKESSLFYRAWSKMNRRSFNKSFRLFTISERMAELLSNYVKKDKIITQPIWSIFQENNRSTKKTNPFVQKYSLENKFIVQYSGNIGLSHNVEILIDLAEMMIDSNDIIFQIIGRGPRKLFLEQLVMDKKLPNTMFLPFQSDEMFPFSLSAADIGVVILDDITSKGSVPSKSFNLMSYGIPSLYIASDDSQLNEYAKNYKHAVCCSKDQLRVARDYILELKNNPIYLADVSRNAENASKDFERYNADKFVNLYLE